MYICIRSNRLRKDLYNGMIIYFFSPKHFHYYKPFAYKLYFVLVSLLKSGPNMTSQEDWGVNYRALHDLFQISQNRKSSISYEVGVQMVEIYNEQVRDLLSSDGPHRRYPSCSFSSILLLFFMVGNFNSIALTGSILLSFLVLY